MVAALRRKPRQLEHGEQAALLDWCEHQWFIHEGADGRTITVCLHDVIEASLNGAHLQGDTRQRAIQWKKLAKLGAKKNAPDLMLNYPRGKYSGMKIEMKKQRRDFRSPSERRNAIRAGQADYLKQMQRFGYYTCVAYGWVEAAIHICTYFEWDSRAKGLE